MAHGALCRRCGEWCASRSQNGLCPNCEREYAQQDQERRMAKPTRQIYDSPLWRKIRQRVVRRDRYRCADCGRHRRELWPNETLLADHTRGLRTILDEGSDPYDLEEIETRCSTCSGRKDGAMSGLARPRAPRVRGGARRRR